MSPSHRAAFASFRKFIQSVILSSVKWFLCWSDSVPSASSELLLFIEEVKQLYWLIKRKKHNTQTLKTVLFGLNCFKYLTSFPAGFSRKWKLRWITSSKSKLISYCWEQENTPHHNSHMFTIQRVSVILHCGQDISKIYHL